MNTLDDEEGCAGCKTKAAPKWRQDFPIEWEGDHYVTRREMVRDFSTLGSLLLASASWVTASLPAGCYTEDRMWSATSAQPPALDNGKALCCFLLSHGCGPCIAIRTPEGKAGGLLTGVYAFVVCRSVWTRLENGLFVRVTTASSIWQAVGSPDLLRGLYHGCN